MKNREIEWLLKEKYNGVKSDAFYADCKRLSLGEPLDYLIGWSDFLGCKIWLDERPLIPRSETEYWTEEAIKVINGRQELTLGLDQNSPKVLDLCAGSGCIGTAILKHCPSARVDFGELDAKLLDTILKNLKENGINRQRTDLIHTNLFSNLPEKYDYILSNPPYIDPDLDRTQASVKNFEPYVALYGGMAGMEIITDLIKAAPRHLDPGGQLWLEHEPEQVTLINELSEHTGFTITTHPDQYNRERYSILVLQ
jgi:release factor glutamine methyltransferase